MSDPEPVSGEQRDLLTAYLAGELSDAERAELEEFVRRDPAVAQELESLRRSWALLDVLQVPDPSEDFTRRVVGRARRLDRRRPRRVLAWGAAVAAMAASLLVAVALWQPSTEKASPSTLAGIRQENPRFVENLDELRSLYKELVRDREDRVDVAKEIAFLEELDKAGLFADEDRDDSL